MNRTLLAVIGPLRKRHDHPQSRTVILQAHAPPMQPRHRLYEAWREAGLVDVEERILSLGGGYVMRGRKHHA